MMRYSFGPQSLATVYSSLAENMPTTGFEISFVSFYFCLNYYYTSNRKWEYLFVQPKVTTATQTNSTTQ